MHMALLGSHVQERHSIVPRSVDVSAKLVDQALQNVQKTLLSSNKQRIPAVVD
jgi:hypothetical protein